MQTATAILVLLVAVALAFDFTNGFHDTANAMATSIATHALPPKTAVLLSGVLNLIGAFLSVEVALTVTNAVVHLQDDDGSPRRELLLGGGSVLLLIVLAGLVGAITWNLLTWLLGLPSSSSHALFGGLIGATVAGLGWSGVNWNGGGEVGGVVGEVILPALASPVIAGLVAAVGTWWVCKVIAGVAQRFTDQGFRWGQIGSACLVALAHGTNDAQKTMGVITLGLIASGHWSGTEAIPWWVKVACALAITSGTLIGGWRIIRTLGKGLVEITPPQGMTAETASASIILISSHLGLPLSTTHVTTGSVVGTGLGKPGAVVRWRLVGRMAVAWVATLPAAAVVGALTWWVADLLGGGLLGAGVITAVAVALGGLVFSRARRNPVRADNVNDRWRAPQPRAHAATRI
ncbi:anion permease [Kineococcus sp. GCM10028916]|uniref:inorganic phosphate transporter n=1 Tax=Kineococcus sp. GCM10028916 TaxID=3273394 RepID=UPI00362520A0